MNLKFDALESCLQAIEQGQELDTVLAHYPDLAEELRPLLEAALQARGMAASEPAPAIMRRGQARLLQRAAELRAASAVPPRSMGRRFPRFALAMILAGVFLLSGTRLVRASATALPGENLYPVKRTWEGMRLFFIFDHERRELLEFEFENERLHEVNELLLEGRDELIRFAGIWTDLNGVYYASGIRVVIRDTTARPADGLQNGTAVIVSGYTNLSGYVEAEAIELLPAGTNVPPGEPVEIDSETDDEDDAIPDQNDDSDPDPGRGDQNENEGDDPNDHGDDRGNENGSDDHSDNGAGGQEQSDDSNNDSENKSDGDGSGGDHSDSSEADPGTENGD